MTEMSNADRLEEQLMTMGRGVQYPPTPDLPAAFWQGLEAAPRQGVPGRRLVFAGTALAAAVFAVALGIALIAPARDAAADLFGRINIFETNQSTGGLPTDITGREVTVADAETALGARILRPTYPAALDLQKVLLQDYGQVKVAALFYSGNGIAFVLFTSNAPVGKGIHPGSGASVETVSGVGDEAYWLQGQRIVQSYNPDGSVVSASIRVTDANTLVWSQGGTVYRIEGAVQKDMAIAIAQSVR
jgi:hypothetical protein